MNDKRQMKIVLFGGTFDPIHLGHVRVAEYARSALRADELIFIPAYRSPHKPNHPTAGRHRLAMIRIAVEGLPHCSVSDCELVRRDPSYTLDTISYFRERFGSQAQLFWLVGADQIKEFDRWYCVNELLAQCRVCVMVRGGYPPPEMSRFKGIFPDNRIQQLQADVLETPRIPISSTDVRKTLAGGHIPEGVLPAGVAEYIRKHHLYGFKGDTNAS